MANASFIHAGPFEDELGIVLTAELTVTFGLYRGPRFHRCSEENLLWFPKLSYTNYQWLKVNCLRFSGPRNQKTRTEMRVFYFSLPPVPKCAEYRGPSYPESWRVQLHLSRRAAKRSSVWRDKTEIPDKL